MAFQNIVGRLVDVIFGYDFFVSYTWTDGSKYAHSLYEKLKGQSISAPLPSTGLQTSQPFDRFVEKQRICVGTSLRFGSSDLRSGGSYRNTAAVEHVILNQMRRVGGAGRAVATKQSFESGATEVSRYALAVRQLSIS